MSAWKDPRHELPPEHTDVVVWVQRVFAIASWVPEDGGWFCAEWDDTEDADFVDLWAAIPPMDADGASARQGTIP
jgi:hypothetical protein